MPEPLTPLYTEMTLLGGALEAASGTAETVTAALTGTFVYDAKMELDDTITTRPAGGNRIGQIKGVPTNFTGTLTFKTQPKHGDATLTLIQACAFSLQTGAYKHNSAYDSNRKTATFVLFENGRKKTMYGCAGTATFRIRQNAPVEIEWRFRGIWGGVADTALPSNPTYAQPYKGANVTFTVAGAAAPMYQELSVDLGNDIQYRPDLTKNPSGLLNAYVAGWDPRLTVDTEARLVADSNPWGDLYDGDEVALSCALSDGANTLTIAAPKGQYRGLRDGTRGGLRTDTREYALNVSSGDDGLTFTAA